MTAGLLIALLFGLGAAVGVGGLTHTFYAEWREKQEVRGREARVAQLHGHTTVGPVPKPKKAKKDAAKDKGVIVSGPVEYKGLQGTLDQAEVYLKPTEFYLISAGVCAALGGLGFLIAHSPVAGALLAGAGFYLPRWWLNMKKKKRRKQFTKQLPGTLQALAQSISAGLSLTQAIATIAKQGPSPSAEEFARAASAARLGYSPGEALRTMVRRLESPDLEIVATAIEVQSDVGGSLAGILNTVAGTIREREHLHGEVMALTAQQDMMGKVLALLPVAVGLFFWLIKPEYMSLLTDTSCGKVVLGAAGFEIALGYFVAKRLTKVEL